MKQFLFLAGEYRISMPLVFKTENWSHSMTMSRLFETENNCVRRHNMPREQISGIVHYANCDSDEIEGANLSLLARMNIPCWPDPNKLIKMLNRHVVMQECIDQKFVDHDVHVKNSHEMTVMIRNNQHLFQFPYVVKFGNSHRGIGKALINCDEDLSKIEVDGSSTIEPFFVGDSVRILFIGEKAFGLKVQNESSWIKNSPGGEVEEYDPDTELVSHAQDVMDHFCLDVAGVDYIVENSGKFHFLEVNQYPSLTGFDDIEACAALFLRSMMDRVELAIR